MEINVNGKTIPLKISMWIVDDERLSTLTNEKPKSVIWSVVAMIYTAHLNYQRRQISKDPLVTTEELEIWVDDQYATEEGQKYIKEISAKISDEVKAIAGNTETAETTKTDEIKGETQTEIPTPEDEEKKS